MIDGAAFVRKRLSERIGKLTGPGSNHVQGLLRRLFAALDLHEQDARRLRAEVWRVSEDSDSQRASSPQYALIPTGAVPVGDTLATLVNECRPLLTTLATVTGPGALAVQTAARQLLFALEMYEQDRRRLGSEALRRETNSGGRRGRGRRKNGTRGRPHLLLPPAHFDSDPFREQGRQTTREVLPMANDDISPHRDFSDERRDRKALVSTTAALQLMRLGATEEARTAELRWREAMLTALLPVIDSIEGNITKIANDEAFSALWGAQLEAIGALRRLGVRRFEAGRGEPFDVDRHEVVEEVPECAEVPAGHIVAQRTAGYVHNSGMLRRARVVVTKPAARSPAPNNGAIESVGAQ